MCSLHLSCLRRKFKNIELIVSKCYHSSGIISMIIVFQVRRPLSLALCT